MLAENKLNIECISPFKAESIYDFQTQDGGEAKPEDLLLEQQLPFPILQVRRFSSLFLSSWLYILHHLLTIITTTLMSTSRWEQGSC